jgi:branched-subunit amino acid transport protein
MSGAGFESAAALRRGLALALAVLVAHKTKSAAGGMIAGVLLLLVLSWLR